MDGIPLWLLILLIVVMMILWNGQNDIIEGFKYYDETNWKCKDSYVTKSNTYDEHDLTLTQWQCLGNNVPPSRCYTFPNPKNSWNCSKTLKNANRYKMENNSMSPANVSDPAITANVFGCDGQKTPECLSLYKAYDLKNYPTTFADEGFNCGIGNGRIPTKDVSNAGSFSYLVGNSGNPVTFETKEVCNRNMDKARNSIKLDHCENKNTSQKCTDVFNVLGLQTYSDMGFSCTPVPELNKNLIGKKGNENMKEFQFVTHDGIEPKDCFQINNYANVPTIRTCSNISTDPFCQILVNSIYPPTYGETGFKCKLGKVPMKEMSDGTFTYLKDGGGNPRIYDSVDQCVAKLKEPAQPVVNNNCANKYTDANCTTIYDSLGLKTYTNLGYGCHKIPEINKTIVGKKVGETFEFPTNDEINPLDCDMINRFQQSTHIKTCSATSDDATCKSIMKTMFPTIPSVAPSNISSASTANAPNVTVTTTTTNSQPSTPTTMPTSTLTTVQTTPETTQSNPPVQTTPETTQSNPPIQTPTISDDVKKSCCFRISASIDPSDGTVCPTNLYGGSTDCNEFYASNCAKALTEYNRLGITDKDFADFHPDCACYASESRIGFPTDVPPKCYKKGCGLTGSYMDPSSRNNACNQINCSSVINFNKLTGGTNSEQTNKMCADWLPTIEQASQQSNSISGETNGSTPTQNPLNPSATPPPMNDNTVPQSAPITDNSQMVTPNSAPVPNYVPPTSQQGMVQPTGVPITQNTTNITNTVPAQTGTVAVGYGVFFVGIVLFCIIICIISYFMRKQ